MTKTKVKIEHVYHSGFTLETENYFLVFDYYKGNLDLKDKKTIVFSSHSHEDHFNPEILKWKSKDISYVFSSDIEVDGRDKNIHFMEPYQTLELEGLKIQSFGSTDLGVSFLVHVDGLDIFHAGDLYWWHWEEDSEEKQKNEERIFKDEVERILGKNIDIAFFPVDPRLGEAYYLGGQYFIEKLKPKYFLPMHFGDNFQVTGDFIHKMREIDTEIIKLNHRNQIINI